MAASEFFVVNAGSMSGENLIPPDLGSCGCEMGFFSGSLVEGEAWRPPALCFLWCFSGWMNRGEA